MREILQRSAKPMGSSIALAAAFLCLLDRPASAFEGECLLEVTGVAYLDGRCNITMHRGGSFEIGTGQRRRSKHFAMVNIDTVQGAAVGFWNGKAGESHAHESLGPLVRQGGCWVNAQARVCAWRAGTRDH